jgi:hypothetical protein
MKLMPGEEIFVEKFCTNFHANLTNTDTNPETDRQMDRQTLASPKSFLCNFIKISKNVSCSKEVRCQACHSFVSTAACDVPGVVVSILHYGVFAVPSC